ncbi:hypothetical protein JTE90_002200 [Oedothorax gibbosus]|uniref:Uncharacterized protein n=1 Tax=Oedothorax gibbosus TaxID=931172 RepID=A0AAV6VI77_9ARAC|nr:hypothetical protein JTE90_002200 [Oedothorax gibbosus]
MKFCGMRNCKNAKAQSKDQANPPSSTKEKEAGGGVVATVPSSSIPPGYTNKDYVSCYANANAFNQNESLKALTTSIVCNTRKCRNRSCGHEITTGDLVNRIRLGTDKPRIHITELIKEYSKWECPGEEVHCGICDNLYAQTPK